MIEAIQAIGERSNADDRGGPDAPPPSPFLTAGEIGRVLRLDPSQVRRLAAAGKIPCHAFPSLGGRTHYRFVLEEVLDHTRVRVPQVLHRGPR